jgi:transposase
MCHRLGLIDIINENIPCNTDIDIGTLVVGMVCDTLSGRSPLYQVEDFIAEQDTELLFGARVDSHRFNDDALGNALDRIHKKGTLKLFTEVSLKAASVFNLDTGTVSYDTTSVNVWGDYAGSEPGAGEPHITHGHSKDKRGDLKQFMVSMLCVEGNIPLSGRVRDGNASDNKLNNEELQRISRLMRPLKNNISELLYVADCKVIAPDNMRHLNQMRFVSRFPATYKEHDLAIGRAMEADDWEELGILAETPSTSKNRPRASYRAHETAVAMEGKSYRALVVQTAALDKRRTKSIERQRHVQKEKALKEIKSAGREVYRCRDDAETRLAAITAKKKKSHWNITGGIRETPVHAPGRAPKNGERKIVGMKYTLELETEENTAYHNERLTRAGCFVMITNVPKSRMTAGEILKAYKQQYGVEKNFSFLKEPLIANDTFLKKPSRIDALAFILLLSLMIWNLIQRTLRSSAEVKRGLLEDLNRRPTKRPTGYLFMCQLSGIIVLTHGNRRMLSGNGIKPRGMNYLRALGFDEKIYTTPPPPSKTLRRPLGL